MSVVVKQSNLFRNWTIVGDIFIDPAVYPESFFQVMFKNLGFSELTYGDPLPQLEKF